MAEGSAAKVSGAIAIGAGVVAVGSLIVWLTVRSSNLSGFGQGLPRPRKLGERRAGGMTLAHYTDRKMPLDKRVRLLQDLTWESVQDPRNRKTALAMTARCPARDGMCEVKAIGDAIFRNVRYTGDIAPVKMGANGPVEGIDLYQSAARTMEFRGGDCDDHAVALATMLTLNGIPAKFRITAQDKRSDFSHIYVLAGLPKLDPKRWIALDTTLPNYRPGFEMPYGRHADYTA
jgi:hypothetical protein